MDYREFRRIRAGGISNLPPASGAVLDSAASRLQSRLTSSATFAQVTVEKAADPERLLVAGVKYRPGTPVAKTSSHLEAIWISELRLPGLDAFSFITKEGHVELEAFTGDKSSGYFLTLHLLAEEGEPQDFETRTTGDPERERADPEHAVGRKRRWFQR